MQGANAPGPGAAAAAMLISSDVFVQKFLAFRVTTKPAPFLTPREPGRGKSGA
jgi:hypothetical protein